jgi:transglutaminase-like putative cysteine protease
MDFSAWFEVYLGGHWHTVDARHNTPRIGRILMATGRDATDVALSTAFGPAKLAQFEVVTDEIPAAGDIAPPPGAAINSGSGFAPAPYLPPSP